jgi:CRISPR-associated protein Cas2
MSFDEKSLTYQLEKRWLPVLNLTDDSLRVYPLDASAKAQAKVFGSPPLYEPPDYLIL